MEDWKETTIGEISNVQTGPFGSQLHEKDYVSEGTPIVTVEHLGNRKFTTQNLPLVSDADKERLSKYVLSKGDLVFSRVGSVDRCTYTFEENDGWMFSGRCLRVRPRECVDSLFLYYYFNLQSTKLFIKNIAVGATMPSINTSLMCEVPVSLPPLATQKKIAEVLSSLDDKIELNNKINANLEQQAQAIFKSWFVDFEPFGGEMPAEWKVGILSDIAKLSAGGDKPKETSKERTDEFNVPIFSNGLDDFGLYGYTKTASIFEEAVTVSARGTIGYVCLRTEPYVPIVRLVSVIPKCKNVSAKYLYFTLKNKNISGTGTTQQQLTVPAFSKEDIIIPSAEEMENFTNILNPMFEKIIELRNENKKLSALRDTLLPKLMSGELEV